jgi:hypothetical protein
MTRIRGNRDGPNRRNESYRVPGRGTVPRAQLVGEVEAGRHPGAHVVTVAGRQYIRDNPDNSTADNVNQD